MTSWSEQHGNDGYYPPSIVWASRMTCRPTTGYHGVLSGRRRVGTFSDGRADVPRINNGIHGTATGSSRGGGGEGGRPGKDTPVVQSHLAARRHLYTVSILYTRIVQGLRGGGVGSPPLPVPVGVRCTPGMHRRTCPSDPVSQHKHDIFTQCRVNVGTLSETAGQH